MDFKGPNKNIALRLAGIFVTMYLVASLVYENSSAFSTSFMVVLLVLQVVSLYRYILKGRDELLDFLESIQSNDFSQNYPTDTENDYQNQLNEQFNKIIDQFKEVKNEHEADYQYLKNIVQHVGIGLITFDKKGNVQIMNTAAKKLLKVNQVENIEEISSLSPELVDIFKRLKTGGRDLIKLDIQGDLVQLAVYAIELTLRKENFKLVSVQNIQNELEEKEMEAWQNLVRVLTHEIMNSVTPISSLANTVEAELSDKFDKDEESQKLSKDEIGDLHLAMETIQKRSAGLIRFVQDFRNLTHIPKPKIEIVHVKPMIDQIFILMKTEIEANSIHFNMIVDPEEIVINADKELIEQVLINLIKNATQAFDDQTNRIVEVKAYQNDKGRPVISVKDNGSGIDKEALQKIFIPFFTTKKQGSGIGLSLSRQIMRQHQGVLAVKSILDEGTEFELRF